ncbi:hypothetical protein AVEN_243104-1 [Araneus ventricosus]|uniref:Uncharacterized protein n=1 Tax=Araneus ventricosus TaxID=182803 RepID=A0A4Y2I227_ARAVE|nr:hypothetical protein AVEN_243104-1 [Araneus ventricosus]
MDLVILNRGPKRGRRLDGHTHHQPFTTRQREGVCPPGYDWACIESPNAWDLQWNRVSNLEHSSPEAETLPPGHPNPTNIKDYVWWPNDKVLASEKEVSRFETRFHEDPPCLWAWCTLNLTWVKRHFRWYDAGAWRRGVPAQELFSSSDRGSKQRGPSENSSSERDVNITKQNDAYKIIVILQAYQSSV